MAEIQQLISQFEDLSLPKEAWTHEAHLITAMVYVARYGRDKALCLIRPRIISYNQSLGGINDENGGYHETLTVFWIDTIHDYCQTHQLDADINESQIEDFLLSPLASKSYPFQFYKEADLMSVHARSRYVQPALRS
jgi:hypothetical protein